MIDLVQWRVTIGAFNAAKSVIVCITNDNECMCDSLSCQFFPLKLCSIYLFQICLILSGDIETNPGPVNKSCPSCDAQVPLRKKVCVCGHVFNQFTTHKFTSF